MESFVFFHASWVMILKLSKKVHFLQFCADFSHKPKSVKAIYMYEPESYYNLSENNIVYRGLATIHEIAIKLSKAMLTQQEFNKVLRFQTLISSKH